MTQLKLIADPAPHATYFYSGSNHAGEILGLAEAQRHIGVAIHQLDKGGMAMKMLCSLPRFPSRRVVANVARNGSGKPIIMLCRDRALLPQGDAPVEIEGERYTVGFRKIAANVARKAKQAGNLMADVLRGLFGRDAGAAGKGHKVVIQLTQAGWEMTKEELDAVKASGSQVFVDSGAFSEVEFGATGPQVVLPIAEQDTVQIHKGKKVHVPGWETRLAAMTKIAEALGPKAYLVAPDMVGNQAVTFERLTKYAETVRRWRELGANVIVVLQKGAMSQIEMDAECQRILGFDDYVRGIPSKKAAATTEELVELANALPVGTRLHLLGLGVEGDRYQEVLDRMPADRPLFCDSVGIRRMVGRTNGKGGAPRILTVIRDAIVAEWNLTAKEAKDRVTEVKAEMLRRYFAANPQVA